MLKRVITALLLLSLPLAQARAVVICPMDEAPPPASDCACPHAHHSVPTPPSQADVDHGDCCQVEFAPAATSGASVSAQHDDFTRGLAPAGTVIEIAPPAAVFEPIAAARRAVASPPSFDPYAADGTHAFLLTGRLRL